MPKTTAPTAGPQPESATTHLPHVELLDWPAQEDRRRLLAALGEPRLLLLAANAPTPTLLDDIELCILHDSPPNVVVTAITALQQRILARHDPPVLDEDGLLWFRGRWVAVSDSQIPVVDLLLQNYENLVRNDAIRRTYRDNGGSDSPASLRTLMRRVSQRIAKVGLRLHVVRRRGVILAAAGTGLGPR